MYGLWKNDKPFKVFNIFSSDINENPIYIGNWNEKLEGNGIEIKIKVYDINKSLNNEYYHTLNINFFNEIKKIQFDDNIYKNVMDFIVKIKYIKSVYIGQWKKWYERRKWTYF